MASYDYTLSVLLLGDSSSGKEELVNHYISPYFIDDTKLTIGWIFIPKLKNLEERRHNMNKSHK